MGDYSKLLLEHKKKSKEMCKHISDGNRRSMEFILPEYERGHSRNFFLKVIYSQQNFKT